MLSLQVSGDQQYLLDYRRYLEEYPQEISARGNCMVTKVPQWIRKLPWETVSYNRITLTLDVSQDALLPEDAPCLRNVSSEHVRDIVRKYAGGVITNAVSELPCLVCLDIAQHLRNFAPQKISTTASFVGHLTTCVGQDGVLKIRVPFGNRRNIERIWVATDETEGSPRKVGCVLESGEKIGRTTQKSRQHRFELWNIPPMDTSQDLYLVLEWEQSQESSKFIVTVRYSILYATTVRFQEGCVCFQQ